MLHCNLLQSQIEFLQFVAFYFQNKYFSLCYISLSLNIYKHVIESHTLPDEHQLPHKLCCESIVLNNGLNLEL